MHFATTGETAVCTVQEAMGWFGYYGGPTRRPLLPLARTEATALQAAFTSNGFKD